MKKSFLTLFGLALALTAGAQSFGLVTFTNDFTSLVTNGLTMTFVSTTNGIRAVLYVAADGVMEESMFLATTSSVPVVNPGRYNGGYRSVPPFAASNAVMLQVRAFETNYGGSYEAALTAPPMNGRRALVGRSAIARVILGGPIPSSATPRVGAAVGPIVMFPADGSPVLTANDLAVSEGSNGTATANFMVRLLAPSTNEITVDFTTQDGTALAGSDYVATNGTLVFLPGETVQTVPVTLLPDLPPESVESFNLILSNPVHTTLVRSVIVCTVVEVRISSISIDTSITFNTLAGKRYTVEKSSDGVNWSSVTGGSNVLAAGTSLTVVDRGSGCSALSLYRASLLLQ